MHFQTVKKNKMAHFYSLRLHRLDIKFSKYPPIRKALKSWDPLFSLNLPTKKDNIPFFCHSTTAWHSVFFQTIFNVFFLFSNKNKIILYILFLNFLISLIISWTFFTEAKRIYIIISNSFMEFHSMNTLDILKYFLTNT